MDQRNLILAFALSMAVMLTWGVLAPQPPQSPGRNAQSAAEDAAPPAPADRPGHPRPPEARKAGGATAGLAPAPGGTHTRFHLANDLLRLQVDERGRLVSARLTRYRERLDPASPLVSVLRLDEDHSLYIHDGLLELDRTPTFRRIGGGEGELRLEADLGDGRVWRRHYRLKPGSYVVDVEDRITGNIKPTLFRQVVERHPDKEASTYYEFVGPVGMIEDQLLEEAYKDLDAHGPVSKTAAGGWIGIMNRYFIAVILGDGGRGHRYYFKGDGVTYQAGLLDTGESIGNETVYRSRLYIGPKSIPVMQALGVGLERSVDFGWFAFIAKPLHDLLLFFYRYIPNYGWCIVLLVVLIKLLFFWPTQKSYESMAGMRKLQPEMQRLREMYGDDRQRLGQEMMELYKKHQVNPMGGCLPIVIQIPVFFALYKVLLISIEMRHAPFVGWIHDLSDHDPYFVLPVLMGLSMLVQQRLNPKPPDPMQAKVMQFLPVLFTVMFLFFPAGLVLYWLVNNILSIAQQWYVMKVKQAV